MTKNASDLTQIFIIPTTVSSGMSRLMSASCTDHIYTNGTIMDLVSVIAMTRIIRSQILLQRLVM